MKPVLAAFLGGLLCAGTLPAYTQTPAPHGSPCAPRPTLFSISDRDPLNPSILYVCAADSEQEVPGFIYVEADEDPFPMSFEELKAAGLVIQKVDASAESITFVYGGRSQTLSADAPEGLDSLESLVPWLRERRQSLAAQAAEKEKEKIQQAQGAAQKIPNPFSGNPLKKTAPESVAVPSILPTQILPAPAQKSPEEEIREIDIEKLAEVLDQIRKNDPKKLPIDQAQTLLKIHEDLEQGLQNLEGERLELANRRQQNRQPILQLLQEAQKARQGAEEKKREADKLKGEEKRRLQEEA
ncbi:MAG: hypothetical protein HY402_00480, partial [Elusimicrobia bacterium]|nr:hypothetical protein [Elusimicrobiota bacterium]